MRTGFKRLIFATVMSIAFFVLAASTSIERTYTYDTTDSTRTLSWSGSEDGGYSARVSVEIPDSRDSFFVSVPKTFDIVTGEELHAVFHGAGQDYEAALDTDGDERMLSERRYFLAPYWGKTAESLSIEFHADLSAEGLPSEFDIVMLDSRSFRYDVRFGPDILTARADDFFSRNGIVSRTEWGADEELRYEDSEVWKRIAERNAGYVPTAADKKASERRKAIDDYLAKEFSADYSLASIDRTE
ncbi:MAG TPA: hypothetical protein PK765_00480 [bacterium]|nr:hypothetical protein [bacterium]